MNVIKTIIGGLIGAVVAVVILNFLMSHQTADKLFWFPVVTGFLTGMGAMILGGKSYGMNSLLAGVSAAIIALVAIMMGNDVLLLFKQQPANFEPLISEAGIETAIKAEDAAKAENASESESSTATESEGDERDADESDADADESDADEIASNEKEEDEEAGGGATEEGTDANIVSARNKEGDGSKPDSRSMDEMKSKRHKQINYAKYIFSGLGVLIAYQLGRGFGSKAPREEVVAEN